MSPSITVPILLASLVPARTHAVQTQSVRLSVQDGVVTGCKDLRTGESFTETASAPLTGLLRLKDRHLFADPAVVSIDRDGPDHLVTTVWRKDDGESRLLTRMTPADNGDVIVTQRGISASPGLVGVQWGLLVPDTWDVLVPGHSGLRFGADSPPGRHDFDYPISWEAQFVLLQSKRGGLLIYAEDNAQRFKALHVEHQPGRFLVGLETRCTAPFGPITQTDSVRWRLHPYQGEWLAGAATYRAWATRTFGLISITDRRPSWIKDVQFVVIAGLDKPLLDALAQRVRPQQTLIYVPGWRRDGYDRNYPDYTPVDGFADQVRYAKGLGFRVMLHVNYFGVTPENAAYQTVKPYHCRDPFTGERLYWDWQRATPPIKFAYINPAAKTWRNLFVQRMTDLCAKLSPDALHLDQTLCIYNDANGPIDGMNMMQGNLALHRALREALPDVALSGEGLNEITCRYEAFAQRHVYGINHADQDWNNALIDRAHPVSSSLLANTTTIYGYLGMTNPRHENYYFAWRRAYERFGVIPTLSHPFIEQLTTPPPIVQVLLTQARWFQQARPVPDFSGAWDAQTLFAYRTHDNHRAEFRRDPTGVVLLDRLPTPRVISRRITGVTSATLPGSIPDWRAYDAHRVLALDADASYVYLDRPRDMSAFHLEALPETATVRRVGLRPEFATVCLDDRRSVVARFWDFVGPSCTGENLCDGTTHQNNGSSFSSACGTQIHPEGQGIFAHPPWRADRLPAKGVNLAKGLGSAWMEFDVHLPSDVPARFESGVGLRTAYAAEHSDGVTFRVTARPATGVAKTLTASRHTNSSAPEPLALDLSPLRGQAVTLRLETSPGPAGSVTFDWALWTRPQIVLAVPRTGRVEIVSPRGVVGVITGDAQSNAAPLAPNRYALSLPMPGTAYLLFERPRPLRLPADLSALPFSQALVFDDGNEAEPHGFMHVTRAGSAVGGVTRKGLFAHPPPKGQTHVDFLLSLPAEPIRLTGFTGIRDGADGKSNGVGFRLTVNGRPLWTHDVHPDGTWTPFDVSLAAFAGRTVILSLITDALGDYSYDWAQWGEPRLVPGSEK